MRTTIGLFFAAMGIVTTGLWSQHTLAQTLPGEPASSAVLSKVSAQAFGPCTFNANNCEANVRESDACTEEPGPDGATCTSEAGARGCGQCTGGPHQTCKSTNETLCTDRTIKCCAATMKCQTTDTGCQCLAPGGATMIGLKITCP